MTKRWISVTAEGEASVAPDLAIVSFAVSGDGKELATTRDDVNRRASDVLAKLRELGIADGDLNAPDVAIHPQYDYRKGQRLIGYRVTRQMTAKVAILESLGGVLDGIVAAGANEGHGTQMTASDPSAAEHEALAAAVAAARAKAEALAEAAGVSLGGVSRIEEEDGGTAGPLPRFGAMAMEATRRRRPDRGRGRRPDRDPPRSRLVRDRVARSKGVGRPADLLGPGAPRVPVRLQQHPHRCLACGYGLDAAPWDASSPPCWSGWRSRRSPSGVGASVVGRRRTYVALLRRHGRRRRRLRADRVMPLLILAALTGTLSTDPNESGPITTVEQAMLASHATRASAATSTAATTRLPTWPVRVGALAAGGPSALRDVHPGDPARPALAAGHAVRRRRVRGYRHAASSRAVEVPAEVRRQIAACGAREGMSSASPGCSRSTRSPADSSSELPRLLVRPRVRRRCRADGARLLRRRAAPGGSSVAAGWLGRAHRPAEHDGLQPPAIERAARADPTRADARDGRSRCCSPARCCPRWTFPLARRTWRRSSIRSERDGGRGLHECGAHLVRPVGPRLPPRRWAMAAGMPFLVAGGLKAVYDVALYFTFRRVRLPRLTDQAGPVERCGRLRRGGEHVADGPTPRSSSPRGAAR